MIMLDSKFEKAFDFNTYVALGSFDGLHIGHMSLIKKAIEKAKLNNAKSMVYTFKNHPLTVVNKALAPKLLLDNNAKIKLLEKSHVDVTCMVEFNEDFMKILPEDFIMKLCTTYNVKGIVVGFNYRFGYKNSGDINLLKELSVKYNFELIIMEALSYENEVVSSTKIRNLISNGEVKEANEMLIEPYMLSGKVIVGKGLGKKIGFPTANLEINKNFVIPGVGVYYTNVLYNFKTYRGITSVGYNPTVQGTDLTVETYILDFNEDIYGKEIELYFIEKTREEIKFSSLDALIEQLKIDKEEALTKEISINI